VKILAIDIETSPALVYTWRLFKTNIGINQIERASQVICFSAAWVGDDKGTYHLDQRPKRDGTVFYGGLKHTRQEMLGAAHDLLGQADALVHYNGKSFDTPHLNREFLQAGLPVYEPVKEIDLLHTVRKRFRFQSTRLDHVLHELGLAGKEGTGGFDLWKRCLPGVVTEGPGDEVAWRQMEKYNRRDVSALADLYKVVRPWIPQHPSVPIYDGHGTCPRCAGDQFEKRGFARTKVSVFQQYRCLNPECGHYFRGTKRVDHVTRTDVASA
jgi:hypothetical protein